MYLKECDPWFARLYPIHNLHIRFIDVYVFIVCDRSHGQRNSAAERTDHQVYGTEMVAARGVPSRCREGDIPDLNLSFTVYQSNI